MSKIRDSAFAKDYDPFEVDRRLDMGWATSETRMLKSLVSKRKQKYERCNSCGAKVIMPCVLCQPEEYECTQQ